MINSYSSHDDFDVSSANEIHIVTIFILSEDYIVIHEE